MTLCAWARVAGAVHRAGELTAVWVPDDAQEALRDLTRAREYMKHHGSGVRVRVRAWSRRSL